jgi:hypothetical protein
MMNLHSHLSRLEVIGIIGGRVISEDGNTRQFFFNLLEIVIEEAVPCQNISESSNAHSVEMNPASQ